MINKCILYRITLLLIFTIAIGKQGMAQKNIAKRYLLKQVDIQDKRLLRDAAVTKTTIDSLQKQESSGNSLAELLTKYSPLFVKSYGLGSTATVSFRGTAASHTQVEWNGLNINNPMIGQVDFSLIPSWFIDRIDLLHGGSSIQEGSGALGGSILLASQPRWDRSLYGQAVQTIGSFGTYQTFLALGGGNRYIQGRIRCLYEEADNDFRFRNIAIPPFEIVKQRNAHYRKKAVTADLFWNMGKGNVLSLNGWYQHANRQLPTIMSYEGAGRDEYQVDDEIRIVAKWAFYREQYDHSLSSGFITTDMDYFRRDLTSAGAIENSDSQSKIHSYYNKYKGNYRVAPGILLRLNLNGDYHRVTIWDYKITEGYIHDRVEAGGSLSLHYQIHPRLSAFALLRQDYIKNKFSPLMPSLGVEYHPLAKEELAIRFNATRNYHHPTLNDLYWMPGGNPKLRPEEGYSGDFALTYVKQWSAALGMEWNGTVFCSWIDDWIVWRPSEFGYWSAENIQSVFSRGLETTIKWLYQSGEWNIYATANYAYTKTTNENELQYDDNSKGKQLIYIPLHKANVMGNVTWKGFYLNYVWSYNSERFTTSSNSSATRDRLPQYALHNISIGKQFTILSHCSADLFFKVKNLTDIEYQAILWRAMPRRNYEFQLKLNF